MDRYRQVVAKRRELADLPADVAASRPEVLARAYRDYHRYSVTLMDDDGPVVQERDVLIAGKVVVVMPIDIAHQEIVLIRQFRLPAHLANGRGDIVEFVAGRVEAGESLAEAARRECREEIGVAPGKLTELFTFLSTPGVTDEEITMFVAAVDATSVREGALTTPDGEHVYVHRVSMDAALDALDRHTMRASPLIIGLQWLALNRRRIPELLG
jgi:ADP-ribose pyrophosphatase